MERVLLVEDHGLLAHSLAAGLTGAGWEALVVDVRTTQDPLPLFRDHAPAIVLLDLDLGARDDATPLVAPLVALDCRVVMLTGSDDAVALARCVAAGAVGLLGKDIAFDDLLDAVQRVARTGGLLSRQERTEQLALLREHEQAQEARLAPFHTLTRREAEVLGALMRGRTVEQIAADAVVSVATVRSQVKAIRRKLGVSSQVAAIGRALEAGWQPPRQEP